MRSRGFTLIEILLVCLLVAALAAIVAPSLSGSNQRSHLDATARAIVALSRAARAKASAEGRAYFLVVDGERREIRLSRARDPLVAPDQAQDAEAEGDDWVAGAPWARTVSFEDGVELTWAMVAGTPFAGKAGTPPSPQIITTSAGYQTTLPGAGAGPIAPTQGTGLSATASSGSLFAQNASGNQAVSTSTNYITMPAPSSTITFPRITFSEEGTADDSFIDLEAGTDKLRVVVEPASGRCRILTAEEYDAAMSGALPPNPAEKAPGQ
ncbi:MAG TPA: prepilin-type N-terminal cleavage/methylation domain-containing protein [Planctomycetota bacterium]|nr:prepilin-type N-terminal cleavage/methylation domain-containing protein [Planctomycetota bacterium]